MSTGERDWWTWGATRGPLQYLLERSGMGGEEGRDGGREGGRRWRDEWREVAKEGGGNKVKGASEGGRTQREVVKEGVWVGRCEEGGLA